MKKLLAIVLLLCMLTSSAFAAGALERTETRVVREAKDNGKYDINIFIQVKNTGDTPVGLDTAKIYLYDANNTVLKDTTAYYVYPPVLQPGEVGYASQTIYSVEADVANALSSYSIEITPETNEYYISEIAAIDHETVYAEVEKYSVSPILTYTLTNNTMYANAWNICLVAVVRSAEGKILDLQTATLYDVGVPAGGVVLYEMDLGSYNLEAWTEAGHTIGDIETYAYIELD